jgi:hypothetical protein
MLAGRRNSAAAVTKPNGSPSLAPHCNQFARVLPEFLILAAFSIASRSSAASRHTGQIVCFHFAAGRNARNPVSTGMGALPPGHHEHRKPIMRLPTDAGGDVPGCGCRSPCLSGNVDNTRRATAFRRRWRTGSSGTKAATVRRSTARQRGWRPYVRLRRPHACASGQPRLGFFCRTVRRAWPASIKMPLR